MRQPTSPESAWAWWEQAIRAPVPPAADGPQVGFYRVRKWFRWKGQRVHASRNEWVPARIWIEPGDLDPETGELMTPEQVRLEIDGRMEDPWRETGMGPAWQFVTARPISESEYRWLRASSPLLPKSPRGL